MRLKTSLLKTQNWDFVCYNIVGTKERSLCGGSQGKMDISNKILVKSKENIVLDVIQGKDRRCSLRKLISELKKDHEENKVEKKSKRLNLAGKDTKVEKETHST